MRSSAALFLLAFLALIPASASALGTGAAGSFDVDIMPEFPQPNGSVTITPQSTQLDLAQAKITTTANGATVAETTGGVPILVPLGSAGKATKIVVTATINGASYTKTVTILPQDIALILEADTSTHPWYLGANLLSSESPARIIALADFRNGSGTRIPSSSLSYSWYNGKQYLAAQSGIGKNVLSVNGPVRYRNSSISVRVSSTDGAFSGGGNISVAPLDPLVRVYANDPLLGPDYDTAVAGSASMADNEATYRVVPYYFPEGTGISWKVNSVDNGTNDDLTVRATGTGAGTAVISVTAAIPNLFLTASQNFTLSFGASKSLGIFGL